MFKSIPGEGDKLSLGEAALEENFGGVCGRQTLEARDGGYMHWGWPGWLNNSFDIG